MALDADPNGVSVANYSPGTKLVAITPNDSTDLTSSKLRALWVGTGGNVAVIAFNDTAAVTLANVPSGTLLPVMATKVMATNTTASNIVGIR